MTGNRRGDFREVGRTRSFRGSKSRNKVSVGEPAEGSLVVVLLRVQPVHRSPSFDRASGPSVVRGGWKGLVWAGPTVRRSEEFIKAGTLRPACRSGEVGRSILRPFPLFLHYSVSNLWLACLLLSQKQSTTSNGGPLGSCIDEERRELRYLV